MSTSRGIQRRRAGTDGGLVPIGITLELTTRPRSTLVTVTGELDLSGYAFLRDGLLKVAADASHGVIVDINALIMSEVSPASVFPLVARRIQAWPGIPLSLVTRRHSHLRTFHRYGTDRFVAVHADVATAEEHQVTPIRQVAERTLPRTDNATGLARAFVRDHVAQWDVPTLVYDGALIVTELVTNAIEHTLSPPTLRLELRGGRLTIAVTDDNDHPAVLLSRHDPRDPRDPGLGLRIVAHAAQAWGSSRRWSGGKVVWAVLTSPRPRGGAGTATPSTT